MTTTDAAARRDADDREVIEALAEAWGVDLLAAARFGRETGRTGLVSGWRVTVDDGTGPADHLLYLDEPGDDDVPGTAVVTGPGGARRIWRYPEDPGLPALRTLALPEAARVVLDRLGVPARLTALTLASYRPGRRAVVQVSTDDGDLFVKVVPPASVSAVVARHRAWFAAGLPTPPVLATAREGLVVLGALAGRSAVEAVADADPARFAQSLAAVRARIAAVELDLPARPSPADRFDWYAERVAAVAPALAPRVAALAARAVAAPGPRVTVHGDLHLAQLLVSSHDPHEITGLLDLDTSGSGDAADDDAALWAHLVVLAERGHPGAAALAAVAHTGWGGARERIAAGTAALLLGHALSGHLPVERAVELAEALRAAPDENPLTAASSSPHAASGT